VDDKLICPACGEKNPPDLVFCKNCQARLKRGNKADDEGSGTNRLDSSGHGAAADDSNLPAWLRDARDEFRRVDLGGATEDESEAESPPPGAGAGSSDLLAGLASQQDNQDEELPEWVARITGMTASEAEGETGADSAGREDKASAGETYGEPEMAESEEEISAWKVQDSFADEPGSTEAFSTGKEAAQPPADDLTSNDEIHNWLRQLDANAQEEAQAGHDVKPATEEAVPDWVRNLGSVDSPPQSPPPPTGREVPDWVKGMEAAASGVREEEPRPAASSAGRGAAIEGAGEPQGPSRESDSAQQTPGSETGEPAHGTPALRPEPAAGLDVDAVFASMQLPEWLSDVMPAESEAEEDRPPAAKDAERIAPAELPSWVQAMRPMEPVAPTQDESAPQLPAEPGGPLAGLQGVLPAVAGAAKPSSKPRAQAERLEVTDQQKAHSALLEQLLETEIRPIPMRRATLLGSQRLLRWGLGGLLVLTLGVTALAGSSIFPLPAAVPNETAHAIDVINQVPADSHVLVVFDYQPATMGEMEATAASLMDHLLLLKHPILAVISTSPTGSALAERFMIGALADRTYQRGSQYVDLGYLPGGLSGVRAFAADPARAAPLGAASERVWDTPLLRGISKLSDFAAIVVLTDGLESGRIWIEQTAAARGVTPMVIVSSAQAGPMLLPYATSGQIGGLVAGLNGAAGAEMANAGLPGFVRRYWDAYSLGSLLAALVMIIGGSWHFLRGLRERRMKPEM
jgi:hypothetical protein